MNLDLLMLGLTMMVIGLGFVLSFLCLLIFSMHIMSALVRYLNKIFPEEVMVVAKSKPAAVRDDEAIAVAIAAVIAKR